MKVQIKREETFKPVTIELTFETEEGLGLFSQLFNYSTITGICPEFWEIWEGLKEIRAKEGQDLFDRISKALRKTKNC